MWGSSQTSKYHLQGWIEHSSPSTQDVKKDLNLQILMWLLKCLKIMENATFLSKDNQVNLNVILAA